MVWWLLGAAASALGGGAAAAGAAGAAGATAAGVGATAAGGAVGMAAPAAGGGGLLGGVAKGVSGLGGVMEGFGPGVKEGFQGMLQDQGLMARGPDDERGLMARLGQEQFSRAMERPARDAKPLPIATGTPPSIPRDRPMGRTRMRMPRTSPSLISEIGRPQTFDAGYFPHGGGFRVPMLPPDELDETGHKTIQMHLMPGEEVSVLPNPNAPGGGAPMPGRTEGEARAAYGAEKAEEYGQFVSPFEEPSKMYSLGMGMAAAAFGGNPLSGYARGTKMQEESALKERQRGFVAHLVDKKARGYQFSQDEQRMMNDIRGFLELPQQTPRGLRSQFEYDTDEEGRQVRRTVNERPAGQTEFGQWMRTDRDSKLSQRDINSANNDMALRSEFLSLTPGEIQSLQEQAEFDDFVAKQRLKAYDQAFSSNHLDTPEGFRAARDDYRSKIDGTYDAPSPQLGVVGPMGSGEDELAAELEGFQQQRRSWIAAPFAPPPGAQLAGPPEPYPGAFPTDMGVQPQVAAGPAAGGGQGGLERWYGQHHPGTPTGPTLGADLSGMTKAAARAAWNRLSKWAKESYEGGFEQWYEEHHGGA